MEYGLSLGSGGARGFAHLGVIKVLERAGFKPDIISGTSAGSIVGSLYAHGYSPLEILDMGKDFEFSRLMRYDNPIDGLSSQVKFKKVLEKYLGDSRFKDLHIKFLAVATNLRTGKEAVFSKGRVVDAVLASCSLLGLFNPKKIKGELYADGALTSPVPVNALKCAGVKHVVSVALDHLSKKIGSINIPNLLLRSSEIMIDKLSRYQELNADVVIRIPVHGYSGANVKNAKALFDLGVKTARKHLKDIKKLLK